MKIASKKLSQVAIFASAISFVIGLVAGQTGMQLQADSSSSPRSVSQVTGALDSKTYIDMHCHFLCLPREGSDCFINDRLRKSYKFKFYLKAAGVTEKQLQTEGDQAIDNHLAQLLDESTTVKRAVLLAMDGYISKGVLNKEKTEVYIPNELVIEATKRHPQFLFGASINPHRPDALERLEWAKKNGAVLIKWIPSTMGIDPANLELVDYYQKLVELKIPLLVHTGEEKTFSQADDILSDPLRLELPLKLGVTVIAAHLASNGYVGKERNFDRLLTLFKKYPNLYGDISALTQINRLGTLAEAIKTPALQGRLLYGTDWPLQFFPLISPWYHINNIGFKDAYRIRNIKSMWDKDVALKKAIGVPEDTFTNVAKLLLPTP